MRVWKNERGLTLTELMAAVVILGLIAVPLTSLGTTVLKHYREDQQLNQAVLLAQSQMVKVKMEVERTGELPEDMQKGRDGDLKWEVVVGEKPYQDIPELKVVEVTVRYLPTPDAKQESKHTLTAVARVRP